MVDGEGSKRLFAGWLFELYHFTLNANRHMPLAAAHATTKSVREELSKHYAEEWDHYSFFSRALEALGYSSELIKSSQPLPMTSEMANFMRQAARVDILAYAACSAVLEGTTLDEDAYTSYYDKVAKCYDIPKGAIQPLFDHVALDKEYGHRSLFMIICENVCRLDKNRADLILSYGHQMAEHVLAWTDNIWSYYSNDANPVPRLPFELGKN
jgi:pyrroloquinoline quinone (PQQ) biosynthesis protein C